MLLLPSVAALTTFAVALTAYSAIAQEHPDLGRTQIGALIMQHESEGGRNIPNYKFDRRHTAGGLFQITDTNWRAYAPGLGIDLDQYPNAMSAPEQLQGQVAGKMYARDGVMPWTCCNKTLARELGGRPVERRKAAVSASATPPVAQPIPHQEMGGSWNVFAEGSEGGQSFLITGQNQ